MRIVEVHVAAGYPTLDRTIEELTRRGFTESFRVVDGRLRALGTGETLKTEDLVIRDYYRFAGTLTTWRLCTPLRARAAYEEY